MKHLIFLIACLCTLTSSAQNADLQTIAERIVNENLEVVQGEVVNIVNDMTNLDLVEELYVSVYKAGGIAQLVTYMPDANLRVAKEVKLDYLKQPNWAGAVQRRMSDCIIVVESTDDPGRWAGLDASILEAFRESDRHVRQAYRHDRVRVVTVGQTDGIPTPQVAAIYGTDYSAMKSNFWKAMNADYNKLHKTGSSVTSMLESGQSAKITSPYGTDVSFRLAKTEALMSCGKTTDQKTARGSNYAWLPAGDAFIAVDPSSANGSVVVPTYYYNGEKIQNLTLKFKDGHITDISDPQMKERILGMGVSAVPFSCIDLGLNPHSKVIGDFRSFEMAGMVTVCIGENTWAGGDFDSQIAYNFHLVDATLIVGGKEVVKDGALARGIVSN